MPTCLALMHSNIVARDAYCAVRVQPGLRNTQYPIRNTKNGFTLTELIVVISVMALFVFWAQLNLFGLLRKSTFKAQVQDFVSTMQMAGVAAAQSGRRYEVIVDLTEQSYLLRQITSPDLSEVLEEEIISENILGNNCWIAYVEFDDGEYTNEGRAKFRVGRSGWQYGGKIVLLDETQQPYSIVINRLNRIVELKQGDVSLLVPKAKEDVPF